MTTEALWTMDSEYIWIFIVGRRPLSARQKSPADRRGRKEGLSPTTWRPKLQKCFGPQVEALLPTGKKGETGWGPQHTFSPLAGDRHLAARQVVPSQRGNLNKTTMSRQRSRICHCQPHRQSGTTMVLHIHHEITVARTILNLTKHLFHHEHFRKRKMPTNGFLSITQHPPRRNLGTCSVACHLRPFGFRPQIPDSQVVLPFPCHPDSERPHLYLIPT